LLVTIGQSYTFPISFFPTQKKLAVPVLFRCKSVKKVPVLNGFVKEIGRYIAEVDWVPVPVEDTGCHVQPNRLPVPVIFVIFNCSVQDVLAWE
jgi:hypothetical protein